MWYFAWILGVLLACAFGIVNAMWLEIVEYSKEEDAQ
ncbi:cytochrome bd-I oxidase subunit CydX [Gallaecimonas xiamenensis]|uniref:Cyd operon protein YbgTEB3 n=1 Tax=Gallaecimonas xiamenensis 3-C-1 TaxID=745411 RepID=K2IYD4_9GAMM|nr:cytochrome bd-I oxidase subunit CydX [Gallaecimonas xiamenensis]EKE75486.1 cyd operon protein YbgTEB3 [Gallaecimonas xiamenensis 3-C-1]